MRRLVSALALSCAVALPVQALDLESLSESDRAAFRAEIRAYLLDNPEVLLEAMQVLEGREAEARAAADRTLVEVNRAALMEDEDDWRGGNPDGDMTIVEFVDYRCGYCKRAQPEITGLIEDDGSIVLIRKELPILGEDSVLASRFAIATKLVAGEEAYAGVSDALMALRGGISEDSLTQMANTFGLDADAIMAEIDSDAVSKIIAENHLLAQRLQIQGTPAFVVGGELLRGYLPQEQMAAIVDQERARD
ncbi:MAG: disulfide bond formation protein DsbA [Rhodobacterales bacterium]|nr:MAG: disulfide bond formation protein DsbA [Rhodobacterales bacterium]